MGKAIVRMVAVEIGGTAGDVKIPLRYQSENERIVRFLRQSNPYLSHRLAARSTGYSTLRDNGRSDRRNVLNDNRCRAGPAAANIKPGDGFSVMGSELIPTIPVFVVDRP